MWCDCPTQVMGSDLKKAVTFLPERKRPNIKLIMVDSLWRKVTGHVAESGINMLVVDLFKKALASEPEE